MTNNLEYVHDFLGSWVLYRALLALGVACSMGFLVTNAYMHIEVN